MSKIPPVAKVKEPLWTTIRRGWGRTSGSTAMPCPINGASSSASALVFSTGLSIRASRWSWRALPGAVFHGHAPMAPQQMIQHPEVMNHGPKINSLVLLCLAIPAVMTLRSLCGYANAYYMNWVSNKVLTDIRAQLFSKMIRQSMDFFNKMQSGFLMSHITNNTRHDADRALQHQQRPLQAAGCDHRRHQRAPLHGLEIYHRHPGAFPELPGAAQHVWQAGAQSGQQRTRGHGRDGRDDAGELSPGFASSNPSRARSNRKRIFRRSNQSQFSNSMRILRSMEAVSPLVETIAAMGVGSGPPLRLCSRTCRRRNLSP